MIFSSRNLTPEQLSRAQAAYDSGTRSALGIATAAGISRKAASALLKRAGVAPIAPGHHNPKPYIPPEDCDDIESEQANRLTMHPIGLMLKPAGHRYVNEMLAKAAARKAREEQGEPKEPKIRALPGESLEAMSARLIAEAEAQD